MSYCANDEERIDMLATAKTCLGYLLSKLGLSSTRHSISAIYNYFPINDRLGTSGQPHAEQFAQIKAANYCVVINLAPNDADNAIENEAGIVEQNGMHYIHIPVDFKRPTTADFEQFCEAMQQHSSEKIWIHCAANMRVSAFIYRYRRDVLGEEEALIARDLNKIWQPYGVWKQFLAND